MKVLFLDECNGFGYKNPLATLVEINYNGDRDELMKQMYKFELTQLGANRTGGRYREILNDLFNKLRINSEIISSGRRNDYESSQFDRKYTLISGNY